jgi:hypothetical protein
MPLGAPNVSPYMYIMKNLYVLFAAGISLNPLINDYVYKGSRGRANAIAQLGQIAGDIFNYLIFMNLFMGFSIGTQFQAMAGVVFILAFVLYFCIKEPVINIEEDNS